VANLKEVRIRIASTSSTQQITKAMKLVSATKLRKAQGEILQMRPYARKIKAILGSLGENVSSDVLTPFIEKRKINQVTLVIVTSDRGLCGGFNANVVKMATSLLNDKYKEQADAGKVNFVCLGKKGYEFFARSKYNTGPGVVTLHQKFTAESAFEVGAGIISSFLKRETDEVVIVYNQFKNAATQILTVETMLPVDMKEIQTAGGVDLPKKAGMKKDYIFEPNMEDILTTLIPMTLKTQLYKAILDSQAAEHGARMVAMDKATDNAGELLKSLRLQYNQARQAAITREISEIVGGAAALA
jgi:F-type H+-transporting ATPase subunit gamma